MPRVLSRNKYSHGLRLRDDGLSQTGISGQFMDQAAMLLGAAKAFNTLRTNRTALRKVESVESRYGVELTFPWSTGHLINFIMGCWRDGLKPNSIRTYVSQIKSAHLAGSLPWEPNNYIPGQIMKGMFNKTEPSRRRIAVTPAMMTSMFLHLHSLKDTWNLHDLRMLWALLSALWAGSFRSSELLSPSESGFLQEETFCWKRLRERGGLVKGKWTNWFEIKLIRPKEFREGRANGINVELFEVPQSRWCPVTAMRAYMKDNILGEDENSPVFRWRSGYCVTNKAVNSFIREACGDLSEYPGDCYLATHSFRAGIASILGAMGVEEAKIQSVGRWQSDAWIRYAKEGRSVRKEDQLNMQLAASGQFLQWAPIPVLVENQEGGQEPGWEL